MGRRTLLDSFSNSPFHSAPPSWFPQSPRMSLSLSLRTFFFMHLYQQFMLLFQFLHVFTFLCFPPAFNLEIYTQMYQRGLSNFCFFLSKSVLCGFKSPKIANSSIKITTFCNLLQVIPRKFSTHCKRKLPQIVTLKSPSGVTYNVGVEEDDEKTMAFRFGWDKFVKDHSLEENDLLVFKFHGVSEFEVLVFDGQTLCEKPTSYFVRKCGHAEKTKGIIDFNATSSRSPKRHFNPDDVETTPNQQLVISPPVDNELEDLIDIDLDFDIDKILNPLLVASHTGYEQEEHINSDIDTASAQLPVISPTSTVRVSEGKYPLSGFKKMRRELSNDNLDQKAGMKIFLLSDYTVHLFLGIHLISPVCTL